MSYTVANMLRAPDPTLFVEGFNANARPHMESAGASRIRISQTVMGGEQAGVIGVAVEFDSIDSAVAGISAASAAAAPKMRESGIQLISRVLVQTKAERGTPDGPFGSILQVSGDPIDDATWESNADTYWSHMSAGSTGQRFGQMIAACDRTGRYIAVTWTDSLSALQEASTAMFADSSIQQLLANQNSQMISRTMFRQIG